MEDSAEDENGRAAVIIAKNLIVLSRVSYRPCLPSRIGSPDKDFQKAYTEPVLRDGYYLGDQGSCSSKKDDFPLENAAKRGVKSFEINCVCTPSSAMCVGSQAFVACSERERDF